MLAARLYAPNDIRLEEVSKPSPGPGQALLQITEVGICASDVHWYNEGCIGETVITDPLILGHEFAAIVAEVGAGVSNVKPGDRVAVEPAVHCGKCDMCLEGRFNICRKILFCGTPPTDGALCEYLAWPASLLAPIPDSISMGEAAMLEPMAIGVHAVNLVHGMKGKTVGVLGVGAVGLSILQAAVVEGCGELIATDLLPMRLEAAKRLGASKVFDAGKPDVVDAIREATGGRGLDVVFEAAGVNDAVRVATEIVRPGGLLIAGGIPDNNIMTVEASIVRRKELTIQLLRRSNNTLHDAINLLADGKVDVKSYITHRFPLSEVETALKTARDNKANSIRVIVKVS
ncbi:alcohol dehydrogenase catalytic domain-containing protein [uncultured Desulfobulbus sp.]|uniref:alcohol dehydrogenase catalytic domain-containing protein n=1 Tax=uncultured Desulfobulbus sp. TaxID=239745 RepID=UPI0029C73B06|nr:alcohol dehydrogenase catalytic domain-containing protein [uncultured Desulfobulbus sp.]